MLVAVDNLPVQRIGNAPRGIGAGGDNDDIVMIQQMLDFF